MLKFILVDMESYHQISIIRAKLRIWPLTIHRVGERYDDITIWKYFLKEKRTKIYYYLVKLFWQEAEAVAKRVREPKDAP